MGIEDGPPKKKLKQAQLSFGALSPRIPKRKLSTDQSEDNQAKIPCKENKTFSNLVQIDLTDDARDKDDLDTNIDPDIEDIDNLRLELTESNTIAENKIENDKENLDKDSQDETDSDEEKNESLNASIESSDDVSVTPKSVKSNKPLTPKQKLKLAKKEERRRLNEEKRLEKLKKKKEEEDEKRKRQEAKNKKKEEELRLKEEERKKKEDEKKKKDEEKKKKEDEKKKKDEEKKKKDEAKEEEKRKKEEARLLEEKKEAQAKRAFSSFFIPKKSKHTIEPAEKSNETETQPKFMPFSVKPDMRLAGERRTPLSPNSKHNLEENIKSDKNIEKKQLYLNNLKNGHIPLKTEPTWPVFEEEHDVIIIESVRDENGMEIEEEKLKQSKSKRLRAKLFKFHENRRPPYYGTWRKKSENIKPRNPLNKDKQLDYEVDSDSEWEDEGEGEDIDGEDADSEPEQNEEQPGENGYVLDKTFVPHGYLSDEEAADDEEEKLDPQDQKLRMQALKQEFDEEMKFKTQRLKPRLLGCVWISNETSEVSKGSLYESMFHFRAVWDEKKGGIDTSGPVIEESPPVNKARIIPKEIMDSLVKFVHQSLLPMSKLVSEFKSILEKDHPTFNFSKNAITLKIREIASKSTDFNGRPCWEIKADLRTKYGLKPVTFNPASPPPVPVEKPKPNQLISFLKRDTPPQPAVKKRATLITLKEGPPKEGNVSTPIAKKRVPLVTLSTTPLGIEKPKIHVDTPRPFHPLFKAVQEKSKNDEQLPKSIGFVDLTEDSV